MTTDTDRPTPKKLTLYDCTGSPGTEFVLADGDAGPPAERLPFLYVTTGPSMDLPATIDIGDAEYLAPSANWWTGGLIGAALNPLPINSRCAVNLEYWDGKDGWTLEQYACAFARFKAARPDIRWSLYAAHAYRNRSEYGATTWLTAFVVDSVYPGKYADTDLANVAKLIQEDPRAIVCTGWVRQVGGGNRSVEPTEAEVRDIMRRLFMAGVTRLGIWMGPAKPDVHLRLPERIIPMAEMAVEEFAKVHRPVNEPDPSVVVDDTPPTILEIDEDGKVHDVTPPAADAEPGGVE